jgi:hypothetical protein
LGWGKKFTTPAIIAIVVTRLNNLSEQFVVSPRAIEFDFYFRLAIVTGKKNSETEFIIATAKTVKTFLIAETIAITASSFFLLPSSFCYSSG